MWKFIIVCCFVLSQTACYSSKNKVAGTFEVPATLTDTVPFTLTPYNNISVPAILNDIDSLHLMFHTGSHSVVLIEDITESLKSLNLNQTDSVTSWGGKSEARYSEGHSVQIGNFKWDNLTIRESKHSGRLTDGKFGPNFFAPKIIEIDFDHSRFLLHTTLPAYRKNFQKLDLIHIDGDQFIKGKMMIGEQEYDREFMIHSGYGGTILLDDEFVNKHQIGEQLETISESELKDSYGNIIKTKKVILPSLHFGEAAFAEIPIGFFEGSIGRQIRSVLGGAVLKRFNIIFDLEHSHIYLKPNSLAQLPYDS